MPAPQGGSALDAFVHTPRSRGLGLLAVAGLALGRGGVAAPRQRRRPSRRTGREGRPPRRHHRRLRVPLGASMTTLVLNVDGLMSPADSRRRPSAPTRSTSSRSTPTIDGKADIAYRVRFGARPEARRHRDPGLRRPPDDRRERRRQRVERRRRRRRPHDPLQARRAHRADQRRRRGVRRRPRRSVLLRPAGLRAVQERAPRRARRTSARCSAASRPATRSPGPTSCRSRSTSPTRSWAAPVTRSGV